MTLVIAPVKNGRLMMNDMQRNYLNQCIKALEGKDACIEIKRDVRNRTTRQNRYYWGVVIAMLASQTGHTKEEVHEAMKVQFLGRRHMPFGKTEIEISKSTTDIDTAEMTGYIEHIRAWAAQFLSMDIPSPEQVNMVIDSRKKTKDGHPVDSETGEVLDTQL
jgi:hypothetical protein